MIKKGFFPLKDPENVNRRVDYYKKKYNTDIVIADAGVQSTRKGQAGTNFMFLLQPGLKNNEKTRKKVKR